jgi:membrane protein DedA with SNARE-associated domain
MRTLADGPLPHLPGFLNSLAGPLDHFGYWAVLLFVMIEDFGVPVPGETILIAAQRHAAWIITVARFVEVLRQANGIVAGTTGLRWRRFLAFNALGAALWVGTWVSLGYLAGNHINAIYHDITRYSYYLLVALAVVLAAYIAQHILCRTRRRTAPASRQRSRTASHTERSSGRSS